MRYINLHFTTIYILLTYLLTYSVLLLWRCYRQYVYLREASYVFELVCWLISRSAGYSSHGSNSREFLDKKNRLHFG